MDSIYKTHIGWVRQINQDFGLITKLDDETTLVIVADGMGGHKAGEVASRLATESIEATIKEDWKTKSWEDLLLFAIQKANEQIFSLSSQKVEYDGMGTTVEVGIVTSNRGLIAHVGDSRVYLRQPNSVQQLTEDHSLVFALYKSGQIPFEELETHPQKNVILRAIGTEQQIEVDLIPFTWNQGDRILFCTDGLFKHVTNDQITDYLQENRVVSEIAEQLIDNALELGGEDNITIAIIENALPRSGGEGV